MPTFDRRQFIKLAAASALAPLLDGCVPVDNAYYQAGFLLGATDKARIKVMLNKFIREFPGYLTVLRNGDKIEDLALSVDDKSVDPLTRKVLLETVTSGPEVANALSGKSPNNYYKLLGISDASLGARMRKFLFVMQCLELTAPRLSYVDPGLCSALALHASATTFNEPVLAKNFDHLNVTWYACVTRESRPGGKLPSIDNTLSILPGAISIMNPYFAMTHNTLPGAYMHDQYLPGTCTQQDIAEVARSLSEAVTLLNETDNGGYFLLPMIDADDNIVLVESTPYGKEVLVPDREYLVVTNHAQCVHPRAPEGAVRTDIPPDTYLRHARITSLVESQLARGGKLSLDDIKAVMSDHYGGGGLDSVCRHSSLGGTVSTVIMLPKSGRMFVASGHPCETAFVEYKVD